ncbi:MAG TPA: hypothetical protein VMF50_13150 [Candidatus Binataceae bacterium]|jgi:hypothetical protein|nr:hypothetical protein [Candidatus Binataceae bacterium]
MIDPSYETYFVGLIAAHLWWALFATALFAFCVFTLWQCEIPQWLTVLLFVSLFLIMSLVELAVACTSGSIVIG